MGFSVRYLDDKTTKNDKTKSTAGSIEEVITRTAFCEKRKGNRLCQVQFFH